MNTRIETATRRTLTAIRAGDRVAAATASTALSDAIAGALRKTPGDGFLVVLDTFARRAGLWAVFGYPDDDTELQTAIDAVALLGDIDAHLVAKPDPAE